jgi:hypothetical protein
MMADSHVIIKCAIVVSKHKDASDKIRHNCQVRQLPREELMSAAFKTPVGDDSLERKSYLVIVLMFFVCVY